MKKKKFTLIELIIVIVVIGILAAIALPKVTGIIQNAKLSAMINDKETLEKMMILYYQKNDNLPLLNEDQELVVLNNNLSLTKLVQAEESISEDMKTIYTSLQETLKHYNDKEESLYRIDLSKAKDSLSKGLKYGRKKSDKDFYVYSTKTNNVYYYNIMRNGDNEIHHDEFNTTLKESELVNKKFSYNLNEDGSIINNKPTIELATDLNNLTTDSVLKWTYNFVDEDKEPTKISFILNDVEYTNLNNIPTKLEGGEYTIKLKAQDSKGLWSDEVTKTFNVSNDILSENIRITYGNGSGGFFGSPGYFDKTGNFVVTSSLTLNDKWNYGCIYFEYNSKFDYKPLDNMYLEVTSSLATIYRSDITGISGKPTSLTYKVPLYGISQVRPQNYLLKFATFYPKQNSSTLMWKFTSMRIVTE